MTDPLIAGAKTLIARTMTEEDLAFNVVDTALKCGWKVNREPPHRPASWAKRSRDRITHDPRNGWPDVVLVRDGRLIFVELKRQGQDPTPDQQAWLDELGYVEKRIGLVSYGAMAKGAVRVYVWRPENWLSGEIVEVLT